MLDIRFRVPLPPSINRMYKTTRSGGFYKDQKVKDWIREAGWEVKREWKDSPMITSSIMVIITFNFTRDRDIDGGIKPILDLLQEVGVYHNDSQVCALHVEKHHAESSYAEIEVMFM